MLNTDLQIKNIIYLVLIMSIMGLPTFSQGTVLNELGKSFENYQSQNLQEKVFVHTDRESYLSGEVIWFKVYLVDGFLHKPLGLSKVVYVEIIDAENRAVLHAKIPMENGFGNGSFLVPNLLKGTGYRLKAYTSWMKNYSSSYFFEKSLSLLNPEFVQLKNKALEEPKVEVGFFPEGGNLVEGIESKIAFHVKKNGKGVPVLGLVLNELNDTLVKFRSKKFGIGSFYFKPEKKHHYKVLLSVEDKILIEKQLPEVFQKGFTMRLNLLPKGDVEVTIEGTSPADFNLMVHTRGLIGQLIPLRIKDNKNTLILSNEMFKAGISHLTLFNQNNEPICERLYFKYPEDIFNIKLNLETENLSIRQKVALNLETKGNSGENIKANLSMAVYKIDSSIQLPELNINNYLGLSSDLRGKVESPDYYFEKNRSEDMDNLMLTHGWRRFTWKDVFFEKNLVHDYLPEYAGHIINAKVISETTGLPERGVQTYLTVANRHATFETALSDEKGLVRFDLKEFYNSGEIILKSDKTKDSLFRIEVLDPFVNWSSVPKQVYEPSPSESTTLKERFKAKQVLNYYSGDKLEPYSVLPNDTSTFYHKPDFIYRLDDYVRFGSMEDVLREYVTPVTVRKKFGGFFLSIYNSSNNGTYQTEPLILLDGLPVFDSDKIMAYNPLNIERLEIVNRQYYLGNLAFNGILNFVTYKGNLQEYKLDPETIVIDYDGLQGKRDFYSPIYESSNQISSRLPDFRTLLYWTPNIESNKATFYTSDIPGDYVIIVQGLGNNGETGYNTLKFKVNGD